MKLEISTIDFVDQLLAESEGNMGEYVYLYNRLLARMNPELAKMVAGHLEKRARENLLALARALT